MKEIAFKTPVAYRAAKWRTATGLRVDKWETIDQPSPNGIFVVNLSPANRNGLGSCSIEIPVEQLEEVITAMRKVAQPSYDAVQAAKDLLVENGYVGFFVGSEEIRMVAAEHGKELSDEELSDILGILSSNDLETGICEDAIRGAIDGH